MAETTLLRLLDALRKQIERGVEVRWERRSGEEFFLRLPQFVLAVSGSTKADDPIRVSIVSHSDETIADQTLKNGEHGYPDAAFMFAKARERFSTVEQTVESCVAFIEGAAGPIGGIGVSFPKPPPPPSEEQISQFFKRIAGCWFLDYGRSNEYATIKENGDYLAGKNRYTTSATPVFKLILVACDAALTHVELAKQQPDGKIRQLEVLTVTDNEMVGVAKHDEHPLHYRRQTK